MLNWNKDKKVFGKGFSQTEITRKIGISWCAVHKIIKKRMFKISNLLKADSRFLNPTLLKDRRQSSPLLSTKVIQNLAVKSISWPSGGY